MRIPKQKFYVRFKWQLAASATAVFAVAGLWGTLASQTPERNEARIGAIVYSTVDGQETLRIVESPISADAPATVRPVRTQQMAAQPVATESKSAPAPEQTAAEPKPEPVPQPMTTQNVTQPTSVPSSTNTTKEPIVVPRQMVPTQPSIGRPALFVDPAIAAKGYFPEIASQPLSTWFGEWSGNVTNAVNDAVTKATAAGAAPVLVAYNIPIRDCGSYSAGGAAEADAYKSWMQSFVNGIGQRKAYVILEPDALAGISCLDAAGQRARLELIADAVNKLKTQTKASVYIDAGNATWIGASTMASRLRSANVAMADGFALNVSNFISNSVSQQYGDQLAKQIGKRYVIDTSRNGNGAAPDGEWCNPAGRALGTRPTTSTGQQYVDAYLWIKVPGESDGTCNGGPSAGQWWPDYAQSLIRNS
ncbi:glycoside hydrolase family 6 protein [Candidatus Saccharibacteria bacterium]|nr:glycoside hydrolase family 6 protein [Candidatus Saccharibacteria bacterium]